MLNRMEKEQWLSQTIRIARTQWILVLIRSLTNFNWITAQDKIFINNKIMTTHKKRSFRVVYDRHRNKQPLYTAAVDAHRFVHPPTPTFQWVPTVGLVSLPLTFIDRNVLQKKTATTAVIIMITHKHPHAPIEDTQQRQFQHAKMLMMILAKRASGVVNQPASQSY